MVARLKAFIPQGGPANADLDMPEEGFLVKKKLAEWSKKQMFFTKAAEKNFAHLDVAATKASYSITNYDHYVPIQALDTTQFTNEFIAKHGSRVPKLEKDHITVSFSVFLCGIQLITAHNTVSFPGTRSYQKKHSSSEGPRTS